jgi:hypothetical protein
MSSRLDRQLLSRRDALSLLAASATGLLGACAPVARFAVPAPRVPAADRVLQAFVATVVPGSGDDPGLIRAFADPFYSFAEWRSWFAADLCRRASRFGHPTFDLLPPRDRTRVVADGLAGDPVTRRVYTGAVFLAQVTVYVALHDAGGASRLIGYDGTHRFRGLAAVTYEGPERFLAPTLTDNGNWS